MKLKHEHLKRNSYNIKHRIFEKMTDDDMAFISNFHIKFLDLNLSIGSLKQHILNQYPIYY